MKYVQIIIHVVESAQHILINNKCNIKFIIKNKFKFAQYDRIESFIPTVGQIIPLPHEMSN